jgi:hypothetical protein
MHSASGPGKDDETIYGQMTEPRDGRSYPYVMITDPEPITVAGVGAAICLLKVGIERLITQCAKECYEACGGQGAQLYGSYGFGPLVQMAAWHFGLAGEATIATTILWAFKVGTIGASIGKKAPKRRNFQNVPNLASSQRNQQDSPR